MAKALSDIQHFLLGSGLHSGTSTIKNLGKHFGVGEIPEGELSSGFFSEDTKKKFEQIAQKVQGEVGSDLFSQTIDKAKKAASGPGNQLAEFEAQTTQKLVGGGFGVNPIDFMRQLKGLKPLAEEQGKQKSDELIAQQVAKLGGQPQGTLKLSGFQTPKTQTSKITPLNTVQFSNIFQKVLKKKPTSAQQSQYVAMRKSVSLPEILAQFKGSSLSDSETSQLQVLAPQSFGSATTDFETYSDLPDGIKNSKDWAVLTDDEKALYYSMYKLGEAGNEAAIKDMEDFIGDVMPNLDPIFKQKIKIGTQEFLQGVEGIEFSAEKKLENLNKNIKDIQETLAFQKDQLSIEEQQQLSQQLAVNKRDLSNLQQNMAEAGLAFSSPRQEAESDLLTRQKGITVSTKQAFNKAKKSAELTAKQNIEGIQQGIQQTGEAKALDLKSLGLSAEKLLGSSNLPSVPGVKPLGGIVGNIEGQLTSAVTQSVDQLKKFNQ